jgi:hypothetical protein
MALPAYAAAGAGVRDSDGPLVPYPTGISAGDLLVLQCVGRTVDTWTTPTGWTLLYGPDNSTGAIQNEQVIFVKSATGSESGSLQLAGPLNDCEARMYRFTGWANATPIADNFEAGATANGTDNSIEIPSVTTTGTDELVVAFIAIADDNAVASATGETGGDYTEAVAEYTQTTGDDVCMQLQTAGKAAAGTISGGVVSMAASDPWVVRAFAIKSTAGAPTVTTTLLGSALAQPATVKANQQANATLLGSALANPAPQANQRVVGSLLGQATTVIVPTRLDQGPVQPTLLGQVLAAIAPDVDQQTVASLLGQAMTNPSPVVTQAVLGSLLGSAVAQISPSVQQRVVTSLLGTPAAQLSPDIVQSVQAVLLGQAVAAVAPQVIGAQFIDATLLGQAIAQSSPTVQQAVATSLLTIALGQPAFTVAQAVEVSLLGQAVTAIAPSIATLDAQSVEATRLGQAVASSSPTVAQQVQAALLGTAVAQHAPSIPQEVEAALLSMPVTALGPDVAQGVAPSVLGQAIGVVAPSVQQRVDAVALGQALSALAPTVPAPGVQTVDAALLGSPLAPIAPMATQSVAAQLLGQAMALLAPTGIGTVFDGPIHVGAIASRALSASPRALPSTGAPGSLARESGTATSRAPSATPASKGLTS